MAEQDTSAKPETTIPPLPTLEEMQHWTWVMGRAQQIDARACRQGGAARPQAAAPEQAAGAMAGAEPCSAIRPSSPQQQAEMWTEGLDIWQRALGIETGPAPLAGRRRTATGASPPPNGATIRSST